MLYEMRKEKWKMRTPGWRTEFNPKLRRWRKAHMGGRDFMRIVAASGEPRVVVASAHDIREIGWDRNLFIDLDWKQRINKNMLE